MKIVLLFLSTYNDSRFQVRQGIRVSSIATGKRCRGISGMQGAR